MVSLFTLMNPLSLQPTFDNSPQSKVTHQNSPTSIQDRPKPQQHQPPNSPTPSHQHQNRPTLHKQFTYPPGYNETLLTSFAGGLYEPFNSQGSFYLRFWVWGVGGSCIKCCLGEEWHDPQDGGVAWPPRLIWNFRFSEIDFNNLRGKITPRTALVINILHTL